MGDIYVLYVGYILDVTPAVMETRVTHRELQMSLIRLLISTIHLVISPIQKIVDIIN